MSTHPNDDTEDTLDPRTPEDWASLRELGQGMVTEVLRYLQTVRERPTWQPVPAASRERLARPLPKQGEGLESAWRDFTRDVLPYPTGNIHPRFWGWVMGTGTPFSEYGVELSRSFRALKVWLNLKAYGTERFAGLIEQNAEQARHLATRVDAEPELERLAPVSLHVVCFRYVGRRSAAPEQLEAWNRELLCRLHESGEAVPSYTTLHGRYCLRVCINNHRTRREDLDRFVAAVLKLGREIADGT